MVSELLLSLFMAGEISKIGENLQTLRPHHSPEELELIRRLT
jgi:hypothetical protein